MSAMTRFRFNKETKTSDFVFIIQLKIDEKMTRENGGAQHKRPPSIKPAIREGVFVGHSRS